MPVSSLLAAGPSRASGRGLDHVKTNAWLEGEVFEHCPLFLGGEKDLNFGVITDSQGRNQSYFFLMTIPVKIRKYRL